MAITINQRESAGVVIFDLDGQLVNDGSDRELRDLVRKEIKKREESGEAQLFLFDLSKISYVDSTGLGEVVSSYTTVRNKGGDFGVLKPIFKIHDLLQTMKLLTIFPAFNDEDTAVLTLLEKNAARQPAPGPALG